MSYINEIDTTEDIPKIIGQKIELYSLSDAKDLLTIVTSDYVIELEAVGDCCSRSWIEHMDDITIGSTIVNIIHKDLDTRDEITDEDGCYNVIQTYFYELITDKESFTLEMRNSSNGYYGGSLELKLKTKDGKCIPTMDE